MHVKVIKIEEQKDGSALVDLEYSKEFSEMIKRIYNRKRCTKKLIERAMIEGLENYVKLNKKGK